MTLNPETQYADDRNLRARQRLWGQQEPPFAIVPWVLDLAGVRSGQAVLDVGCGNGQYLRGALARGVDAIGCDLSLGMLRSAAPQRLLVNADVTALPLPDRHFDVVLAPHMLYHVDDRVGAARELRRVLRPDGLCVAVTNGRGHMGSLRGLVEAVVRETTPGWELRAPSDQAFSLQNGGAQLATAFGSVDVVRADGAAPAVLRDAAIAADYVASVGDHYGPGTARPWAEVVEEVRRRVQHEIDDAGVFLVAPEVGAFVCRF